jgi:hypothetical protein
LIDFNGVSAELLFGNYREVFRIKADKLAGLVDCNLCKLIFDYTKICNHYELSTEAIDFKFDDIQLVLEQAANKQTKGQALSKITSTLDVLSTSRVTSFTLT